MICCYRNLHLSLIYKATICGNALGKCFRKTIDNRRRYVSQNQEKVVDVKNNF